MMYLDDRENQVVHEFFDIQIFKAGFRFLWKILSNLGAGGIGMIFFRILT